MYIPKGYYVYGYYILDTNELFYIGKGTKYRCYDLNNTKRNSHFLNIINNEPVAVVIFIDNLTNEEALMYEEQAINTLVFDYGYSIDINKNYSLEEGFHLVNQTWGGEGASGNNPYLNKNEEELKEYKRKRSEGRKGKTAGENHPMYGKHHSEESKKKQSISHLGKNAFKDKTEEEMDEINKKRSDSLKGENNGSYGKKGVIAHKAKPYIIISTNGEVILKCRTELYNKGGKKGFFNITERIFKNYILELNGIFIDKILPMMTNVNIKDKERILNELNKYDGWIVRVATKEEIDEYIK